MEKLVDSLVISQEPDIRLGEKRSVIAPREVS